MAPSAIGIANDHSHTPKGKFPYETPRALETEEIPKEADMSTWYTPQEGGYIEEPAARSMR